MRILLIWGESLAKPGSGTVHCLGLSTGLLAGGHSVTIITPRYAGQTLEVANLDVRPIRLPRRGILSFILLQLLTVAYLPWWLLRLRPDAVYARTCFLQGLMALICRVAGVPLVGEVDSVVDEEIRMRGEPAWAAALVRGLDRLNNHLSSGLVCVTRGLRDESIRRGGHPRTTIAIPNAARSDLMQPMDRRAARSELALPEDGFLLGFNGALAAWQGLDLLVEAIARLTRERHVDLRVALMGSGPLAAPLRQCVAARGIQDRFLFLPPGPYEQVAVFLNACDAIVVPIHDPRKLRYGLSVLKFWDAVSVGLPVLVPEGSEIDEVLADLELPGPYRPGDPEALAAAIRALIEAGPLPIERRWRVHHRVRQRYSWPCVARQVAQLIERLRHGKDTACQARSESCSWPTRPAR